MQIQHTTNLHSSSRIDNQLGIDMALKCTVNKLLQLNNTHNRKAISNLNNSHIGHLALFRWVQHSNSNRIILNLPKLLLHSLKRNLKCKEHLHLLCRMVCLVRQQAQTPVDLCYSSVSQVCLCMIKC